MFALVLFMILIANASVALGCGTFETRKRCECKATYALGNLQPTLLAFTYSYDDCGINLGCGKERECLTKCQSEVRQMLGGRVDELSLAGKNKLCSLIASDNAQITANNSIRLWASWKYGMDGECGTGDVLVGQDICCNRRCDCSLVSQSVTSQTNDVAYRKLTNFIIQIPEASYECSSLDTMQTCKDECLNKVGDYFNRNDIKQPHPDKIAFNLFANKNGDETAATKICKEFDEPVGKPGVDVFAVWNNGVDKRGSLGMGRVCCQSSCSCEFVFRYAGNNSLVRPNEPIPLAQPSLNFTSRGYECSSELSDCMTFCRRNAFATVSLRNATFDTLTQTLSSLDAFQNNNNYLSYMCDDLIKEQVDEPGVNVFFRYSQGAAAANGFPSNEDLHIGRLCCTPFFNNTLFVGFNRC